MSNEQKALSVQLPLYSIFVNRVIGPREKTRKHKRASLVSFESRIHTALSLSPESRDQAVTLDRAVTPNAGFDTEREAHTQERTNDFADAV